jgi:uncharacterized protein (DUF58 family)
VEAFRPYAPGDDLRALDWNALARLDALIVRRYTAERALRLDLLLDASASMAGDGKLAAAVEVALALGTMALAGRDGVRLAVLGGDQPSETAEMRGRAAVARLAARLGGVRPAGRLDLGAALAARAHRHPGPALAAVVTDGLADADGIADGLAALAARRMDVLLVLVLGRTEVEPERLPAGGRLEDVESGARHTIVRDAAACAAFRALLARHCAALAAAAARVGGRSVRLVADEDVGAFVTGPLARAGVVRRR